MFNQRIYCRIHYSPVSSLNHFDQSPVLCLARRCWPPGTWSWSSQSFEQGSSAVLWMTGTLHELLPGWWFQDDLDCFQPTGMIIELTSILLGWLKTTTQNIGNIGQTTWRHHKFTTMDTEWGVSSKHWTVKPEIAGQSCSLAQDLVYFLLPRTWRYPPKFWLEG